MARKELERYNISLWDSQIHQMEMLQRSMRSSIIEAWKPALGMTKDIKHMLESPMTDWIRQNEVLVKQMSLQLQPMLGINEQTRSITAVSYTHLDVYKRQPEDGTTALHRAYGTQHTQICL